MEEQMKSQRDGLECTLSGCRESSFFQPFSSWHAGKVCEILFEVHRCAHFRVHLLLPACILAETRGGDNRVPISWNNGKPTVSVFTVMVIKTNYLE